MIQAHPKLKLSRLPFVIQQKQQIKTFVFAGTGAATRVTSSARGIACINTFLSQTLS